MSKVSQFIIFYYETINFTELCRISKKFIFWQQSIIFILSSFLYPFLFFRYTILHSEDSILRQLKVGQSKLHLFPNQAVKQGMETYMVDLT